MDDTKGVGKTDRPHGQASIQRGLEAWDNEKLAKFNQNVLHAGWSKPVHHYRMGTALLKMMWFMVAVKLSVIHQCALTVSITKSRCGCARRSMAKTLSEVVIPHHLILVKLLVKCCSQLKKDFKMPGRVQLRAEG